MAGEDGIRLDLAPTSHKQTRVKRSLILIHMQQVMEQPMQGNPIISDLERDLFETCPGEDITNKDIWATRGCVVRTRRQLLSGPNIFKHLLKARPSLDSLKTNL